MLTRGPNQDGNAHVSEMRGTRPVAAGASQPMTEPQTTGSIPAEAAIGTAALPPSLLVEDLTITGNIRSEGRLQIKGNVRGDITCRSAVIGPDSTVEGVILAESVEIHGRMNGLIYADKVRLHSKSQFEGDIYHKILSIEDGAHFVGKSLRSNDPKAMATSREGTAKNAGPARQTAASVEAAPLQKRRVAA